MQSPASSRFESLSNPIRVAAVIPVFNRRETTLQGLRSLSKIDLSGIDLRVFVVDDASSDGTADAVRQEFPEVEVVAGDGSLHYAGGTNLGIEAARSFNPDFYLMMNDDAVFHEQFLRRMILTALDNERSVVGALLLLWDQPHKVFQVGQTWHAMRGGWTIPEDLTAFNVGEEPFAVECLVGNCTLVPAEAVDECGTMDAKKFPHGWGDAQYFMRLRKAGWRLLVDPKARVWCEPNTYPAPLHSLPKGKILNILFKDRRHPLNFQRQFIARWESAPNKLAALPAFAVYVWSLFRKGIGYGRRNAG